MTLPRVAVTVGDPAGIGPEVCLRMLTDRTVLRQCVPILFGDANVLRRVASRCNLPLPPQTIQAEQWSRQHQNLTTPALLDLKAISADSVTPGVVSAATGRASYDYIMASIKAAMSGEVDAVATGPINKEALHQAGVPFPGHTEIFADQTNAETICMMLTCEQITCSFVTTHVGFRDVPGLLNQQRVLDVLRLSAEAMCRIRNRRPKLTVCGLNPHAGEHGLFGDGEEETIIGPAIEQARAMGLSVVGPLPPDTAFLPQRRKETDCFVCMYHDQGHIPLKALAFDVAVNTTLGLPIIRTSVDHGTALDIAWQGNASAESLAQAVKLACRLARTSEPGHLKKARRPARSTHTPHAP